jgi:biopolymer transport protein ExbD
MIGNWSLLAEEPPALKRIPITVYPHEVIVVRGKMVEMKDLKTHLAGLVPDTRKTAVEVTVYPNSKEEMGLVPEIIRIAKEAGYTNVNYASAKEAKPLVWEITILVSKTGNILVNDEGVAEKDVQACLEKLVEPERRARVTITLCATRLVNKKSLAAVSKACRDAGFKDVQFALIPE